MHGGSACRSGRMTASGPRTDESLRCLQVGKAFIQQFYTVLHSRPKYLHRFYTNNSSLTIGEQDGPPSTTVTGQQVCLRFRRCSGSPFSYLHHPPCRWPLHRLPRARLLFPRSCNGSCAVVCGDASCVMLEAAPIRRPSVSPGGAGMQSIHDLWMTLELEGASAAITSVDAQPSHCQGVVVFVTGELQGRVRFRQHLASAAPLMNVVIDECRKWP